MSYMIECTRIEQKAIGELLKTLSVRFRMERDMSGVCKFTFLSTPPSNLAALVKDALKSHRLQDLGNYDTLNIMQYTPDQVSTYIENNVTNLAQAKTVLKALARLNLYLLKRLVDDK